MTQPRRTYVDQGITFDMETGAIVALPSVPFKARFPRWLKILGFVALVFAWSAAQPGGQPPLWIPWLCWPVAVLGITMFFIDSVRRHPWAWQYFGKSVLMSAILLGARHAWRVHRRHEREAMADAVADAFQQRFGN